MKNNLESNTTEDVPEVTVNLDTSFLHNTIDKLQTWFYHELLSVDTAVQLGIVLGCVFLGAVAGRFLTPKLHKAIEALNLPKSLDSLLHKAQRLIAALIILFLLFVSVMAIAASGLSLGFEYIDAIMRLMAAWVIIRLSVQGIKNTFVRKTIGGFVWLIAALSVFNVLDGTTEMLDGLSITIGNFHLSALTVIKAFFATLVMTYTALVLTHVLENRLEKIPAMSSGSRLLIIKITRLLLVAVAVLVGVTMAGINLSVLAVFTGAVGLGIGLGLQKGVSNLFTGIMLLLDKTIQPGDIIEMENGVHGVVKQMGSRCTEVVTVDNRSYLIPNENLVTHPVINWSRGDSKICLIVDFGVDYKHNPHDIIKIAEEATLTVGRVLKTPAPVCLFKEFGDSSLNFSQTLWINDPENGTRIVKSKVMLALWDAFHANNINIPFPRRDITILGGTKI